MTHLHLYTNQTSFVTHASTYTCIMRLCESLKLAWMLIVMGRQENQNKVSWPLATYRVRDNISRKLDKEKV